MNRLISLFLLAPVIACAANLIENSSFECGDLRGWSYGAYSDSKRSAIPFALTNRYTFHGQHELQMETGAETYYTASSRLYRLTPNTQHTVSAYVRAESDNFFYASPTLYVMNSRLGGDSYSTNALLTTTNWTRIGFTFTTTNAGGSSTYVIRLQTDGQANPAGKYLHWDALQLETGAVMTAYAPMSLVEIGVNLDRATPAHAYFTDETPKVYAVVFNNHGTLGSTNILKWRLYDYWQVLRQSGETTLVTGISNSVTNAISIVPNGTQRLGMYEFRGWMDGTNDSQCTVQFAILPRPVTLTHRTNSIFGSETYASAWYLSSFQRMGIHWNRNLSVDPWSKWPTIAPVSLSSPVLETNRVALNRVYDIEPLVVLGAGQTWISVPAYAADAANNYWPSNSLIPSYLRLVASNYNPWIQFFEVGNEEVYSSLIPFNTNYTNILLTGIPALRAFKSDSIIVAPADVHQAAVSNMLAVIGTSTVDILSTHQYPDPTGGTADVAGHDIMMASFSRFGWNTETGGRNDTFDSLALLEECQFVADPSPVNGYSRHRNYRVPAQLQNIWSTLMGRVRKYFYYEARNTGGHDGYIPYSLFDYPNIISPMGAVYACQINLMENGAGLGTNFLSTNTLSYAWSRSNQVLFALFPPATELLSGDPATRLAVTTSEATAEILDIFGNAYPPGVVLFGRDPVFIRGAIGMSSNTLATSLTIYRTNDIQAPHLTITTFPTSTNDSRFTYRYTAVDDTCLDTRDIVRTNAILYRYRLAPDEASFSGWTNLGFKTYTSLTAGKAYTFLVEAQDTSGNSASAQWPEAAVAAVASGTITGNSVINGNVRIE